MLRWICVTVLAATVSTPAAAESQAYKDCVGPGFTWPWDPVRLSPDVCRFFEVLRAMARGEPGAAAEYQRILQAFEENTKPMPLPGLGTDAPDRRTDDQRR